MYYESQNPLLESHLHFFSEILGKIGDVQGNDLTKKSRTKAGETQVCWQTIAGQLRRMYLMPNTGESDTPLHFRGTFLPVSSACKVLTCTSKFIYIFETLPDRKILYTYLYSSKTTAKLSIKVRGTQKVTLCCPV
jgi:hypothetical protein